MKVSVIVPVYNKKKYIKKCVDSLVNQNFSEYEIVIVDDGSNDGSSIICDEYLKYDFIQVIHTRNMGRVHARKIGVIHATGKYLTFVDSDDYVEKNFLDVLYSEAVSRNADIVECGMNIVLNEKNIGQAKSIYQAKVYDKADIKEEILPTMIYAQTRQESGLLASLCNKLFRREFFRTEYLESCEDISSGEDGACVFSLMLECDVLCVIDMNLYNYVQVNTVEKSTFKKSDVINIEHLYKFYDCKEFDVVKNQIYLYLGMNIIYQFFKLEENMKENLRYLTNNEIVHLISKRLDSRKLSLRYRIIMYLINRKSVSLLRMILVLQRLLRRRYEKY